MTQNMLLEMRTGSSPTATDMRYADLERNAAPQVYSQDTIGRISSSEMRRFSASWTIITQLFSGYTSASPCVISRQDLAIMPGEVLSADNVSIFQKRKELQRVLVDFNKTPFKFGLPSTVSVTARAAAAAVCFVKLLPVSMPLPKAAPDGEGGIMMVWDDRHGTFIVTVDDSHLHAVEHAGTPQAIYHDNMLFPLEAMLFPSQLTRAIQERC